MFRSIKHKFVLTLLFTLLMTMTTLLYFVTETFSEDKKLFVMELNLSVLDAVSSATTLEVKSRLEEIQSVAMEASRSFATPARGLFGGLSDTLKKELVSLSFYRITKNQDAELVATFNHTDLLNKLGFEPDMAQYLNQKIPLQLKNFIQSKQYLTLANRSSLLSNKKGQNQPTSILSILFSADRAGDSAKYIVVADVFQEFLQKALDRSEIAEVFLMSRQGYLVSHPNAVTTTKYANRMYPHPLAGKWKGKNIRRESLELEVDDEPYLCNVSDIGFGDLIIVSQVKSSVAFVALEVLKNRIYLSAAILAYIGLIFGILFARRITKNIQKLQKASESVGRGNFEFNLKINSNDEIETVAKSFVAMAGRIKELLIESQAKGRMESELQTAKLVQDTILTPPKIEHDALDVSECYIPASECGGDYWDAFVSEDKATFLIGDATGHGAAAAIVVSLAKGCVAAMKADGQISTMPLDKLFTALNRVLCTELKGQLLMTMAAVQLDLKTGELLVCNAGHPSPIHIKTKPTGNEAEPLFIRGERLGADIESVYVVEKFQLSTKDAVFLYTDGLSEASNVHGKEWGERLLMKALVAASAAEITGMKDEVVQKLSEHTAGQPQKDDVTFVMFRWKKAPEVKQLKLDPEASFAIERLAS